MLFRIFHRQTGVDALHETRELLDQMPPPFKEYPRFPATALPTPRSLGAAFGTLITERASERNFDPTQKISLANLSDILFAGLGINEKRSLENGLPTRHHPSGGGLYPLEGYLAVYRVESLEVGIYHYEARTHSLARLIMAPPSQAVRDASAGLVPEQNPAAILILTSVWGRNYPKYGEFAYRLSLMEAGHAMQDVLLAATACDVKAAPMAGFRAYELSKILDIESDDEDPLYLAYLGA
jgi:SagB-type dehydrogenase family enzyme